MMGCPDCGRDDSHWAEISALKARIADLEKQLAEERANRVGVDRLRESHYALERMLAEQTKRAETAEAHRNWYRSVAYNNGGELFDKMYDEKRRAEAAEKRVAELEAEVARLNALVDAGELFRFGDVEVVYLPLKRKWRYGRAIGPWFYAVLRDEAIALARELAAKEPR